MDKKDLLQGVREGSYARSKPTGTDAECLKAAFTGAHKSPYGLGDPENLLKETKMENPTGITAVQLHSSMLTMAYPGHMDVSFNCALDKGVTFIRGLPGSGKTTLAEEITSHIQDVTVVEANQYFTTDGGQHEYHPELLPEAHDWARGKMLAELAMGRGVIVSNTFKQAWEIQGYIDALPEGTKINIVTLHQLWPNKHDIPAEVIEKQREKLWAHDDLVDEVMS